MSMNGSVTEFLRLLCKSSGVVVVVGSCSGSDGGTSAFPPSYPVSPLSPNTVN